MDKLRRYDDTGDPAEARKYIVVDLDGTLTNCGHRENYAQCGDWDEFHARSIDDEPNEDVVEFLQAVSAIHPVIALTGCPDKYQQLRVKWLQKHKLDLMIDDMLMRPADDWSSDTVVKPKLLGLYFGGMEVAKQQVLLILEDRDKMVEAWRNLGFNCWQVRQGAY